MPEEYVSRAEFAAYCRSVNGSLARIENTVNGLEEHFGAQMDTETTRRRDDARDALMMSRADLKEAMRSTMSRSYAIIITILTAACTGLLGAVIALVATRGRL